MNGFVRLDNEQADFVAQTIDHDPSTKFKKELPKLILENKHSDAKDLVLASTHSKPEVLDAILEEMLEDKSNVHRFRQGVKIAGFFRTHKVATDFTNLCHVACLVAINDLAHAKTFAIEDNCPLGYLDQQIDRCKNQNKDPLSKLFQELVSPMNDFAYSSLKDDEDDSDLRVWV